MELEELYITAGLAKLALTEKEALKLSKEVSRMLEYFSLMKEVDVSSLDPTSHILQKENRTREDSPSSEENVSNKLLDLAPERDERFIVIPNVL